MVRSKFRFISHLLAIVHDHSTSPILWGSSLTHAGYGLRLAYSGFSTSGISGFLEIKEIPPQCLMGWFKGRRHWWRSHFIKDEQQPEVNELYTQKNSENVKHTKTIGEKTIIALSFSTALWSVPLFCFTPIKLGW